MCGIAGFVSQEALVTDRENAERVLDRMCRRIAHRGPDEQGMFVEGPVALGMRRLSIIDLAGGHQPMSGCDRAVKIVFNGEILTTGNCNAHSKRAGIISNQIPTPKS